jgi:hypothetical protein
MTEQTPPATPPAEEAPAPQPDPLPDQAAMTPEQLAEAILARQIARPRITSVRRLAEALLAKGKKKTKKKKARKAEKKVRKLALIPGQKNGPAKSG